MDMNFAMSTIGSVRETTRNLFNMCSTTHDQSDYKCIMSQLGRRTFGDVSLGCCHADITLGRLFGHQGTGWHHVQENYIILVILRPGSDALLLLTELT